MVNLQRLQDLHDRATPVGWDTQPTSSGGVLLKRGKEYPLNERHPQTHLQVVPGVDGELMAEVRNALPELLAVVALAKEFLDVEQAYFRAEMWPGRTGSDSERETLNEVRDWLAAALAEPRMKGLDDPNATVLVFKGDETDAELDAVEKVLEDELGYRTSVVTDKP